MFRFSVIGIVLSQLVLFGAPTSASTSPASASTALAETYSASETLLKEGAETATGTDNGLKTLDIPYSTAGTVDTDQLAWCEDLVARTFEVLPQEHVEEVHKLTLSFDPTIRRGLAGGNTMVIRCVNVDDAELVAVLVHEMGHIVDTGHLDGSWPAAETSFVDRGQIVYSNDPSVELYNVSWEDNSSFTSEESDFVSEYAMTSPYEEFAESYAAYVLHGPLFRFYTYYSDELDAKYAFFRDEVFDGVEFNFASETLPPIVEAKVRHYDVTRLDYDLESFMALRVS